LLLGPLAARAAAVLCGLWTLPALAWAGRSLRLLRLAFRASRPQPRDAAPTSLSPSPQRAGSASRPRLRLYPAGSPPHPAESGSLPCGLPVRVRLLPTPPRGGAVTFRYMCR